MTTDAENIAMAFMEDFHLLDQDGIELDEAKTREVLVEYFEDCVRAGRFEMREDIKKAIETAHHEWLIDCGPPRDVWLIVKDVINSMQKRRVRSGN